MHHPLTAQRESGAAVAEVRHKLWMGSTTSEEVARVYAFDEQYALRLYVHAFGMDKNSIVIKDELLDDVTRAVAQGCEPRWMRTVDALPQIPLPRVVRAVFPLVPRYTEWQEVDPNTGRIRGRAHPHLPGRPVQMVFDFLLVDGYKDGVAGCWCEAYFGVTVRKVPLIGKLLARFILSVSLTFQRKMGEFCARYVVEQWPERRAAGLALEAQGITAFRSCGNTGLTSSRSSSRSSGRASEQEEEEQEGPVEVPALMMTGLETHALVERKKRWWWWKRTS
mmetsp:Transcript_5560/g.19112  ORF Transcript_5560/g.19112 Transcript_5560/m.19112 type:complete len:279 (-) Transcript_5560:1138-1974(-)